MTADIMVDPHHEDQTVLSTSTQTSLTTVLPLQIKNYQTSVVAEAQNGLSCSILNIALTWRFMLNWLQSIKILLKINCALVVDFIKDCICLFITDIILTWKLMSNWKCFLVTIGILVLLATRIFAGVYFGTCYYYIKDTLKIGDLFTTEIEHH